MVVASGVGACASRRRERLALSAMMSVIVSPVLNFCFVYSRIGSAAPVDRTGTFGIVTPRG